MVNARYRRLVTGDTEKGRLVSTGEMFVCLRPQQSHTSVAFYHLGDLQESGFNKFPRWGSDRASTTAGSWRSLAPVWPWWRIFYMSLEIYLGVRGGQDLPRGTEDKSDKLKEDYQDWKRGKENPSHTKRCPFLSTSSDQRIGSRGTFVFRSFAFFFLSMWWFLSFLWGLMHQRQSQDDEGMQTILATDERKTEGRRDEVNAPSRRKKLLVLTPALLLALFCSSFVFHKKKKPTKKFSKSAAMFFLYYSSLFLSPSHSRRLSLHAHSFILSFSTIVACFCAVCACWMYLWRDVMMFSEIRNWHSNWLCKLPYLEWRTCVWHQNYTRVAGAVRVLKWCHERKENKHTPPSFQQCQKPLHRMFKIPKTSAIETSFICGFECLRLLQIFHLE